MWFIICEHHWYQGKRRVTQQPSPSGCAVWRLWMIKSQVRGVNSHDVSAHSVLNLYKKHCLKKQTTCISAQSTYSEETSCLQQRCKWIILSLQWKIKSDSAKINSAFQLISVNIKPVWCDDLSVPSGVIKGPINLRVFSTMCRKEDTSVLKRKTPVDKNLSMIENSLYMCREKKDRVRLTETFRLHNASGQHKQLNRERTDIWTPCDRGGSFLFLLAVKMQPDSQSNCISIHLHAEIPRVCHIHPDTHFLHAPHSVFWASPQSHVRQVIPRRKC